LINQIHNFVGIFGKYIKTQNNETANSYSHYLRSFGYSNCASGMGYSSQRYGAGKLQQA
jgi:hypothetical protein